MPLRDLNEKVFASDDVNGETVFSAHDLHWAKSGVWSASETHKSFAGRTANDVEAHVALKVEPKEAPDDFGRSGFSGLVRSSMAFMIDANNALSEKAGSQNKLSSGVI